MQVAGAGGKGQGRERGVSGGIQGHGMSKTEEHAALICFCPALFCSLVACVRLHGRGIWDQARGALMVEYWRIGRGGLLPRSQSEWPLGSGCTLDCVAGSVAPADLAQAQGSKPVSCTNQRLWRVACGRFREWRQPLSVDCSTMYRLQCRRQCLGLVAGGAMGNGRMGEWDLDFGAPVDRW